MTLKAEFDRELIRRYDGPGPRYTSYPTAVQFTPDFGTEDYRAAARASNEQPIPDPLSLYVHIPFCRQLCYYCGCNKKVTQHDSAAEPYVDALIREIELQAALFDDDRRVMQMHFGGGSPTFLNREQFTRLMAAIRRGFPLSGDAGREFAIEVDPRTVTRHDLAFYAGEGMNRLSLGIQDLDREVQTAVNRIQDNGHALDLIRDARAAGFVSVSVDLIYGLPHQTAERFRRTLDAVIEARPDRLAVYSYAHLPHLFKAQRLLPAEHLPDAAAKLGLLKLTIERLQAAGYVYIGMDHFALPDDELVRAQEQGRLQRNFQGYSTFAGLDLVALGVSAIGSVGDAYSQSYKDLPTWYRAIANGELPVWRGIALSEEDRLRRSVIQSVMCHGEIDFRAFEREWGEPFAVHFAGAVPRLRSLAADGLLTLDGEGLHVTPAGRLLLRPIAMSFDAYLAEAQSAGQKFSKVI